MRAKRASAALLFLLASCGGYAYRAIKPTELPKLGGPTVGRVVGGPDEGKAIAVATRAVETPDGRLIEIRGEFDIVAQVDGQELIFAHPIRAELDEDERMTIWSSNRDPWTGKVSSLQTVRVRQPGSNTGGKVAVGVFLGVLGVLLYVKTVGSAGD